MKTLATAAGAALFASALLLPAATEAQNTPSGVPGFLNPSTGLFTARRALLPAASGLKRSGTLTVTITAVLGSNIPAAVPVSCTVSLFADDVAFDNSATASSVLSRKGKGGTCKIVIPYTFEVASSATTMRVDALLNATPSESPFLNYGAEFIFAPFAVPNGNKSLAVTLAM